MTRTPTRLLAILTVTVAAFASSACHRGLRKDDARLSNPEVIYERAHKEMLDSNYEGAIKLYEAA